MDPITVGAGVASGMAMFREVSNHLRTAEKVGGHALKVMKNGSLIDIAAAARVEPLLIIDADCMNVDFLNDIITSMHTQFAGYYLQAVNLLTTINGVSIANKLAPLNPNRGGMAFETMGWRYAEESYRHRLPTTHNKRAMAMEQAQLAPPVGGIPKGPSGMEAELGKDGNDLKEVSNLSTGKMYSVKITEEGKTAMVPISIRVMANTMPTRSVVSLLTIKDGADMSLKERWYGWRANRLGIMDLLTTRDLLAKSREALAKDRDGVYASIVNRENGNKMKGLFSGQPSLATASNLAIISSDTADLVELKLHGRVRDLRTRQAMFENTNLMILAVVDKMSERVTFYYRGMHDSTTVSDKALRSSNKGGGSDVMDIMKAFLAGSNPNI